jgi:hypothetical protein
MVSDTHSSATGEEPLDLESVESFRPARIPLGPAREIPLDGGGSAFVEERDYGYISQHTWYSVLDQQGRPHARRFRDGDGLTAAVLMEDEVTHWYIITVRENDGLLSSWIMSSSG